MKKLFSLSLIAVLALGFNACKKNSPSQDGKTIFNVSNPTTTPTTPPAPTKPPVGDVPATFTKKAILEEYTGEWCGYCPDGATIMKQIEDANPNKFYGVAVHEGDFMEVPAFYSFLNGYQPNTGFPSGSVSRGAVTGRGSWAGNVANELSKSADCGLALVTKSSGDNLDVSVYIGHNAPITGNTNITLYLIENDIPQQSQSNGGAGYIHQHVFRKVFTANVGDKVNLNNSEKYLLKEFKGLSIAGAYLNKSNLKVLAFVNVDGSSRKVLNAQEAGLNEVKKWD